MKKIISTLICAALVMSNITTLSFAEEQDNSNYTTIDISSVANAPTYAKDGDVWKDTYVASTTNRGIGIELGTMQSKLTNGVLTHNGTPYKMTVETGKNTAINTGGRSAIFKSTKCNEGAFNGVSNEYNYTGIDINVEDGYYSSLKILASATGGDYAKCVLKNLNADETECNTWDNSSKLAIVLHYTDGSYKEIETLTTFPLDTSGGGLNSKKTEFPMATIKGVDAPKMPNGDTITSGNYWNGFVTSIASNHYNWSAEANETYSLNNIPGGACYYINEYTFPVDNTKVLESVHIVGANADYDGVRFKADGAVDYATWSTDANRYYANADGRSNGKWEGMYASMVYGMTAVTKDSDLKTALSTKLENLGAEVTESDINDIKAILEQAKTLGVDLGEIGTRAQAVVDAYADVIDSKTTLYEKIDIAPYANQAAYAKVGDTVYEKHPTIGKAYMQNTLAGNENGSYPYAYVDTGISVDHFKYFSNNNGMDSYWNNWTKSHSDDGNTNIYPTWGTWEPGKTTNTMTFFDVPYLMNVKTNAYTNIDTGAEDAKMKGVDVNINEGYYNELKILSTASNPVLQNDKRYSRWNNMSKLALKLDYADGSYDVVDYMVNEKAAEHSLASNLRIIEKIKTDNFNDRTADETAVRIDPKTLRITSYDKNGTATVKQEAAELTQKDWWNGFAAWTISLQKLKEDWESETCFMDGFKNYNTNKAIMSTMNGLSEQQKNNWIDGTTPRYSFWTAAGSMAGINVFTVPVDSSKVLVNVHFVGSLADNDGVKVDKNGNVIYSSSNEIANGSGAYNNSIWAMTAVTNKKNVKSGFKEALAAAESAEEVTFEMVASLKGAYAQMVENNYEIDENLLSSYNQIVSGFGSSLKNDMLKAADENAFIDLFDRYVQLGYTTDAEIMTKKSDFFSNMPAYLYNVTVSANAVSAKFKAFDEMISGVLVAAVYDKNGNMIECKVESGAETGNTACTFCFDTDTTGKTIKLFALSDFAKIEPLALRFVR